MSGEASRTEGVEGAATASPSIPQHSGWAALIGTITRPIQLVSLIVLAIEFLIYRLSQDLSGQDRFFVVIAMLVILLAMSLFAGYAFVRHPGWGREQRSLDPAVSSSSSKTSNILFDGNVEDPRFCFRANPNSEWKKVGGRDVPDGEVAKGTLEVHRDVINITRLNAHGRYELILQKYTIQGMTNELLPRDIERGHRELILLFEAKVSSSKHVLRCVFKNKGVEGPGWNGGAQEVVVDNKEWTPFELAMRVSSTTDCYLRIDNIKPSSIPSSMQLRRIVLKEVRQEA
jgi:hypothetical protein